MQVDRLRSFDLHAVRQLEALDPGGKVGLARVGSQMFAVQIAGQVEHGPLVVARDAAGPAQIEDRLALRSQQRTLMGAR